MLAFASLHAMAICLDSNCMETEVVSSIQAQWPSIWRWSSVIVRDFFMRDPPLVREFALNDEHPLHPEKIRLVMSRLFLTIASQQRLRAMMLSDVGVVFVLTHLYRRAAQDGHPSLPLVSRALERMLATPENLHIQEFMTASSSFTPTLSERASTTLKVLTFETSKPHISPLMVVMNLTLLLASSNGLDSARVHIAQRSVATVSRVLARMTSSKTSFTTPIPNGEIYRNVLQCVRHCGEHLQHCFLVGGFSSVIEAVEGRVLTSMLKASHYAEFDLEHPSTRTTLRELFHDLYTTIGSYSTYRSVLRALHKSLARIDGHVTDEHLDACGSLCDTYNALRDVVDERWESKCQWDKAPHNHLCGRKDVSGVSCCVR